MRSTINHLWSTFVEACYFDLPQTVVANTGPWDPQCCLISTKPDVSCINVSEMYTRKAVNHVNVDMVPFPVRPFVFVKGLQQNEQKRERCSYFRWIYNKNKAMGWTEVLISGSKHESRKKVLHTGFKCISLLLWWLRLSSRSTVIGRPRCWYVIQATPCWHVWWWLDKQRFRFSQSQYFKHTVTAATASHKTSKWSNAVCHTSCRDLNIIQYPDLRWERPEQILNDGENKTETFTSLQYLSNKVYVCFVPNIRKWWSQGWRLTEWQLLKGTVWAGLYIAVSKATGLLWLVDHCLSRLTAVHCWASCTATPAPFQSGGTTTAIYCR